MRVFNAAVDEAVAKHLCVALQRGLRIDVNRGADILGNAGQRNVFGMQYAVDDFKMVHRFSGSLLRVSRRLPSCWGRFFRF